MDPERTSPTQERPAASPRGREPLLQRIRAAKATYAISAINIAVFLYVETHGGSTNTLNLIRFGANDRSHVWAGEYFRFVTPMFLHIGWMHLLWNTWAGISWCSEVERVVGSRRFLLVYLLSGIGANAASLLGHDAPGAAGASGALFGIVGLALALRYQVLGAWKAFVADRWVGSVMRGILIWTVLGLTALSMDNFAHGGGFVTGAAMGALFAMTPRWTPRRRILGWLAFALSLSAAVLAAAHRWPYQRSALGAYEALKRGITALQHDDPPGAVVAFDDAEAQGEKSATLYYDRGLAREHLGDHAGATKDFERATTAPGDEEARERARALLRDAAPRRETL